MRETGGEASWLVSRFLFGEWAGVGARYGATHKRIERGKAGNLEYMVYLDKVEYNEW